MGLKAAGVNAMPLILVSVTTLLLHFRFRQSTGTGYVPDTGTRMVLL
ncbi:hypothetical protein A2U01_0096280, partial [Trifolium medium]|nr:hypothetical protein [Trifolium medium]